MPPEDCSFTNLNQYLQQHGIAFFEDFPIEGMCCEPRHASNDSTNNPRAHVGDSS